MGNSEDVTPREIQIMCLSVNKRPSNNGNLAVNEKPSW